MTSALLLLEKGGCFVDLLGYKKENVCFQMSNAYSTTSRLTCSGVNLDLHEIKKVLFKTIFVIVMRPGGQEMNESEYRMSRLGDRVMRRKQQSELFLMRLHICLSLGIFPTQSICEAMVGYNYLTVLSYKRVSYFFILCLTKQNKKCILQLQTLILLEFQQFPCRP